MKNVEFKVAVLALVLSFAASSCSKEESTDELSSEDLEALEMNAEEEMLQADLDMIAYDAVEDGSVSFKNAGGTVLACATVSRDTTVTPPKIIVDFGPVNCTGPDGRDRRGIIEITYTGRRWMPNAIITIKPVGYFVNDFGINGSRVIENKGRNTAGNPHSEITTQLQIITPSGNDTIYRNGLRQQEMIAGDSTRLRMDDEFLVSGQVTTRSVLRGARQAIITSPLHLKRNCRWIVAGTVDFRSSGKPTRTLDYGNGTCDRQATVSVGRRSRTIQLR